MLHLRMPHLRDPVLLAPLLQRVLSTVHLKLHHLFELLTHQKALEREQAPE